MKKFAAKNEKKQFVCTASFAKNGKVENMQCKEIAPVKQSVKQFSKNIQKVSAEKKQVKTYFNGEDEVVVEAGFYAQAVPSYNTRHCTNPITDCPTGAICKNDQFDDGTCVIRVPGNYPTIQSAIDAVKNNPNDDAGHTRIEIAQGTYDEFIDIDAFEANCNNELRDFQQGDILVAEVNPGFQILGDKRPFIGFSYANGYERAGDSGRGRDYLITTINPTATYQARIAVSFGSIGGVTNLPGQNTVPQNACGPLTNTGLTGQVAVIKRGTCGFATKTKNAQIAGAAAAIIWNNNASAPTEIVDMGGVDYSVTIPAFAISFADGTALSSTLNPATRITITPVGGVYYPQLGTNYAISKLTHPGGNRAQITVSMTGPLPVADENILAPPVLEQPNFNSPEVGIVPSDWIVLSDSDILGNFARSLHQITAVTGNTITFVPPVPPVGSGGVDITAPGANITFLPNVRITKSYPYVPPTQLPRNLFKIRGVNLSITGIWIDQHPSQPFGNVSGAFEIDGGVLNLANFAVTDVQGTTANGHGYHSVDADVYIHDGYRDDGQEKHLTVVGWAQGVGISSMGMLRNGHVFISGTSQYGAAVSIGGSVGLESLQIFGCANLFQPDGAGLILGDSGSDYIGVEFNVRTIFDIADIYGRAINLYAGRLVCNNPSVRIERSYHPVNGTQQDEGAVHIFPEGSFIIRCGDFVEATGKPLTQPRANAVFKDNKDVSSDPRIGGPGFSLPQVAIVIEMDGEFASEAPVIYSGNDQNVIVKPNGEYFVGTCGSTPGGSGDCQINTNQDLDPNCPNQNLDCNAKVITLNPAKQFNGHYVYVGKEFTLYSSADCPHCLKLTSGSFVGHNAKIINLTRAGSFVTFKVISPTQVLVENAKDIKYSNTCGGGGDGSRNDDQH